MPEPRVLAFAKMMAQRCSDRHYREWHVGFDKKGEKHNDAGGGYTWSKCYCDAGLARESLAGNRD